MVLAIIFFALLMFRQVLLPGVCLLTTDDNIGLIQLNKDGMPDGFRGYWNDSVLLGQPGGLVPLAWNALLVWLTPLKSYINWVHAFDLALASWFLLLFLRQRKIGWVAISLGILTAFWLGSNFTLTYAGHLGKFGVLLMATVTLYCLARALSCPASWPWSILTGGALGFMFLEQLDVALFFGLVLGAYALFLAMRQWRRKVPGAKSAVALSLMGAVALLLAATTMFGTYSSNVQDAAAMQPESPQEKWNYVTQWSFPPEECLDFIAPGYMGWRSGEPRGPYWGRMGRSAGWEQTRQGFMNFKLENMYLGIIPIVLALFAILAGIMGRKTVYPQMTQMAADCSDRNAEIIFFGCVAVLTLLLAFGKFFPLYALFYKLPLVAAIRNPNKFLQVFQLVLGILAAYGFDVLLRLSSMPMPTERPKPRE